MTTPDRTAAVPLTAEEEAELRHYAGDPTTTSIVARLLATLDAARAGEGLDVAALTSAIDIQHGVDCGGNHAAEAAELAREYDRLRAASPEWKPRHAGSPSVGPLATNVRPGGDEGVSR